MRSFWEAFKVSRAAYLIICYLYPTFRLPKLNICSNPPFAYLLSFVALMILAIPLRKNPNSPKIFANSTTRDNTSLALFISLTTFLPHILPLLLNDLKGISAFANGGGRLLGKLEACWNSQDRFLPFWSFYHASIYFSFLLNSAKSRLFLRGYFDGCPLNGSNLVEFALSGAVYWI